MRLDNSLQLELAGNCATVYVVGFLDEAGRRAMIEQCASLPLSVRTLRLDLRAIGAMSGELTDAVRSLLAHWRSTRGGEFRLIASHLRATCTPVATATTASLPIARLPVQSPMSTSMTAAFA